MFANQSPRIIPAWGPAHIIWWNASPAAWQAGAPPGGGTVVFNPFVGRMRIRLSPWPNSEKDYARSR